MVSASETSTLMSDPAYSAIYSFSFCPVASTSLAISTERY
jgi:hypothetical protein